jgi:predicted Zn-dependent protease
MHPAHRTFDASTHGSRPHGLARKGSVVLDATATTLTSRFVDEHGVVLDHFTITR